MKNIGQSLIILIASFFCVTFLAACTPGKSASEISLPVSSPQPAKACTMEAKVCGDGSTVGRTGPNCDFAPCPTPKPSGHSAGN